VPLIAQWSRGCTLRRHDALGSFLLRANEVIDQVDVCCGTKRRANVHGDVGYQV